MVGNLRRLKVKGGLTERTFIFNVKESRDRTQDSSQIFVVGY